MLLAVGRVRGGDGRVLPTPPPLLPSCCVCLVVRGCVAGALDVSAWLTGG
jgi:hypothetical protein